MGHLTTPTKYARVEDPNQGLFVEAYELLFEPPDKRKLVDPVDGETEKFDTCNGNSKCLEKMHRAVVFSRTMA